MLKNIFKKFIYRCLIVCVIFMPALSNFKEDISLHPYFDCITTDFYLYKLNFALNLYIIDRKSVV